MISPFIDLFNLLCVSVEHPVKTPFKFLCLVSNLLLYMIPHYFICQRDLELPLEKRRTKSMTTVYFYEFSHKNMSALSARRHVFGRFEADPDCLSMLCMGYGRAMSPLSSFLLRAGKSVALTSFRGSPARPALAAARTTADSSEKGLRFEGMVAARR